MWLQRRIITPFPLDNITSQRNYKHGRRTIPEWKSKPTKKKTVKWKRFNWIYKFFSLHTWHITCHRFVARTDGRAKLRESKGQIEGEFACEQLQRYYYIHLIAYMNTNEYYIILWCIHEYGVCGNDDALWCAWLTWLEKVKARPRVQGVLSWSHSRFYFLIFIYFFYISRRWAYFPRRRRRRA